MTYKQYIIILYEKQYTKIGGYIIHFNIELQSLIRKPLQTETLNNEGYILLTYADDTVKIGKS